MRSYNWRKVRFKYNDGIMRNLIIALVLLVAGTMSAQNHYYTSAFGAGNQYMRYRFNNDNIFLDYKESRNVDGAWFRVTEEFENTVEDFYWEDMGVASGSEINTDILDRRTIRTLSFNAAGTRWHTRFSSRSTTETYGSGAGDTPYVKVGNLVFRIVRYMGIISGRLTFEVNHESRFYTRTREISTSLPAQPRVKVFRYSRLGSGIPQ